MKRHFKEVQIHESAGLKNLINDIKEIVVGSRSGNQRKRRVKKRQSLRLFYNNPYVFAKKMFTKTDSGKLYVP